MDGHLLALSPQAAEARATAGDWTRGSECQDAEESQGLSPSGDPHHQVVEIGGEALLRDDCDDCDGDDLRWLA